MSPIACSAFEAGLGQGAVVVAQLVERSLPTPEIHGLIPDIGKILSTNCTIEKTQIKKKRLVWLKAALLRLHSIV